MGRRLSKRHKCGCGVVGDAQYLHCGNAPVTKMGYAGQCPCQTSRLLFLFHATTYLEDDARGVSARQEKLKQARLVYRRASDHGKVELHLPDAAGLRIDDEVGWRERPVRRVERRELLGGDGRDWQRGRDWELRKVTLVHEETCHDVEQRLDWWTWKHDGRQTMVCALGWWVCAFAGACARGWRMIRACPAIRVHPHAPVH